MSGAVQSRRLIRGKHRIAFLLPCARIQKIRFRVRAQKSHAIAGSRRVGGKGHKHLSFRFHERRPFIDPEVSPFPVIIRRCQKHLLGLHNRRALQLGNIEVGNLLPLVDLLRPDGIHPAPVFKNCHVQRKIIEGKIVCPPEHSHFNPGILHGIVPCALEHIGTDRPDIVLVSGSIIQVPGSGEIVQLRRPDMDAHDALFMLPPHRHLRCLGKPLQRIAVAQDDPVILRHRGCEIKCAIRRVQDKGIRPVLNKWLIIFCFDIVIRVHFPFLSSCGRSSLRAQEDFISS